MTYHIQFHYSLRFTLDETERNTKLFFMIILILKKAHHQIYAMYYCGALISIVFYFVYMNTIDFISQIMNIFHRSGAGTRIF